MENRSLALCQYFCNEKPDEMMVAPAMSGGKALEKKDINSDNSPEKRTTVTSQSAEL
jgi:hypothetical protein